jgi:hypothetical protein
MDLNLPKVETNGVILGYHSNDAVPVSLSFITLLILFFDYLFKLIFRFIDFFKNLLSN